MHSGLTAFDLFAGAGGLTEGLRQAGFKVLWAVENDPLAADTYRTNHPGVPLHLGDIRKVRAQTLLRTLGLRPGDLDLLAGCAPCQGFSSIRTRNRAGLEDSRNDLVLEFLRFIRVFRPKAILMENVPSLVRDARFIRIAKVLTQLGYRVDGAAVIRNAADFGVPQRRSRLVLMAGRGTPIPFPEPGTLRVSVRDAIGGLREAGSSGDPLHDFPERRSTKVLAIMSKVPHDGGGRSSLGQESRLSCHEDFDGFKDVYGRMHWESVAPTITSGCHNPSKGRFTHPEYDRAITLREAAILQGFREDYFFSLAAGKTGAARLIGNALPPPFVAAHASQVALWAAGLA